MDSVARRASRAQLTPFADEDSGRPSMPDSAIAARILAERTASKWAKALANLMEGK